MRTITPRRVSRRGVIVAELMDAVDGVGLFVPVRRSPVQIKYPFQVSQIK